MEYKFQQQQYKSYSIPYSSKSLYSKYNDDDEISYSSKTNVNSIENQINYDLESQIQFKITSQQNAIKLDSTKSQILPIKISIECPDIIPKDNRPHIDLICIIDQSGSMEGAKLDMLKSSLKQLIDLLSDNDRLSIVLFNDSAIRLTRLMKMTPENKKRTLYEIMDIRANGGTNINEGFTIALEILSGRHFKNEITSIFLLSDGCDSTANILIPDTIDEFRKNKKFNDKFTLNTFGYGNDHDSDLMVNLASIADGTFYFIEKLDTLVQSFADCFGGLISIVAQNAIVTIKIENNEYFKKEDFGITKVYGTSNTRYSTPGIQQQYMSNVFQLISGTTKDFILELNIPPLLNGDLILNDESRKVKIASAALTMEDIGVKGDVRVIKKIAELDVLFFSKDDIIMINEMEFDVDFMLNIIRVKLAETFEKAKKLADLRNYADARNLLELFKDDVLKNSHLNDADQKLIIEDINQAIYNVRPEVFNTSGIHTMNMIITSNFQQRSNPYSHVAANKFANVQQKTLLENICRKKM